MIALKKLVKQSDAVLVRAGAGYSNALIRTTVGCIVASIVSELLDSTVYHFDSWLDDEREQELYTSCLEVYKKNNFIEFYDALRLSAEESVECLALSKEDIREIGISWRMLKQSFPPFMVIKKTEGKIILESRYDVDTYCNRNLNKKKATK